MSQVPLPVNSFNGKNQVPLPSSVRPLNTQVLNHGLPIPKVSPSFNPSPRVGSVPLPFPMPSLSQSMGQMNLAAAGGPKPLPRPLPLPLPVPVPTMASVSPFPSPSPLSSTPSNSFHQPLLPGPRGLYPLPFPSPSSVSSLSRTSSLSIPSYGQLTPPTTPIPVPTPILKPPTPPPPRVTYDLPPMALLKRPLAGVAQPAYSEETLLKMKPQGEIKILAPLPTQEKCIAEMDNILNQSSYLINNSIMGAGKTIMALILRNMRKLKNLIVLAPNGLDENWKAECKTFEQPLTKAITYETLAGRRAGPLEHGFLSAHKDVSGNQQYEVMPYFETLCKQGLLLVVDECQKIKNANTNNCRAASALITYISKSKNTSRVVYLTGTQFDDESQIISFLKYNNIITEKKLFMTELSGEFNLLGAQELIDYCAKINRAKTVEVLTECGPFNKSTTKSNCLKLFVEVVLNVFSTAAPAPKRAFKLDAKNGYYNLSKGNEELLASAIRSLHGAAHGSKEDGQARDGINWGAITKSLVKIELAKVEIFVRLTLRLLKRNPHAKVCLMFNFTESIDYAMYHLRQYNPLKLNGPVGKVNRRIVTQKFNQHDDEYRVLICNTIVAAYGYSLDDSKDPSPDRVARPRTFLISPGYKAMMLHQACYRGLRPFTKSQPVVRFIFGKCGGQEETSILNALARRKDVLKKTMPKQADVEEGAILFPGEFKQFVESEDIQGPDGEANSEVDQESGKGESIEVVVDVSRARFDATEEEEPLVMDEDDE
jgi:hypothetical protein